VIWLLSGLMGYFFFSRTVSQVSGALGANRPLFSYRQVKPLDAVFARALLEASLMTVITMIVFTGAALLGHDFKPDAPLTVLLAFACAWLIGLGWGLIVSVSKELVPELGTLIDLLIQRPLYLVSGVIMPMTALPSLIRELLMLNPLAHVFEIVRAGVASHYHAEPESDLTYAFVSALVLIFIGMLLMRRFAWTILAQ
jgi:capsular polysaccharide transport system permease protein